MKIGLIQMDPLWENKEGNFEKAESFLRQAKAQNISFALFPEMSMTGFSMHPEKIGERKEDSETLRFFSEKAALYQLFIGIGYVEYCEPKSFNRYAVFSPSGELLADYKKIHPFTFGTEAVHYAGGDEVVCFRAGTWTVSPFICYDLRFPEIFQAVSDRAQLIVVPANWPSDRKEHFETLLKARAIENQCYIAGINRTGHARTLSYSGGSMVVDPLGRVAAKAGEGEEILTAELDWDMVEKYRQVFPMKSDRRPELYRRL